MSIRIPVQLKKLGQSGQQGLYIIPYMFTFANACMGLLAVLYAWDDFYTAAAYCIVLAAVFDAIDGRLARMLNSCSSLGMELDSLCDAISFCCAPAIVLYGVFFAEHDFLGMVTVGLFLCAGLFRLAKFNNTCNQQKSFFIGMSTPVAAVFFALLIIYQSRLSCTWLRFAYHPYTLMGLIVFFAYLMISKLRFPTFKTGLTNDLLTAFATFSVVAGPLLARFIGYPMVLIGMLSYIITVVLFHMARPMARSVKLFLNMR